MGSANDAPLVDGALKALEEMGIDYEVKVLSAHRQPEKVREYGLSAPGRGIEVLIAAAGGAAHLPGVLAAWTALPVIGLPLATTELRGTDALYSMVQMPGGVPVATVAINGARNAALLAARILALKHDAIRKAVEASRQEMAQDW
jgi:5-(carboxyamino)imidazole ribonucleotide mutase